MPIPWQQDAGAPGRDEGQDFLSDVLDAAASPIFVLDPEGRVFRWNRAMEALTGVSPREILGQLFAETLLFPENIEEWKREFKQMVTGSPPVPMQYRWRIRDGGFMAPAYSNAAVRDAAGTVAYIVSTVTESAAAFADLMQERAAERRELSRFLHDTISQDLVALSFGLSELQGEVLGLPCAGNAARAAYLTDRCCSNVRALSYMLSPPPPGEPNIQTALEHYAGYMREAGLEVVIESRPGLEDVSPEAGSLLLAAVQEWAGRTIRTRMSARLFIRAGRTDSGIVLELKSVPGGTTAGVNEMAAAIDGWTALKARAAALRGRFEVTPGPEGAVGRLTLPESRRK